MTRPDGTGFRTLTDSSQESALTFSPDGQRVLFVRDLGGFGEQWRTVDVSGRNDVVVGPDQPSNLGYCPPKWTPDGKRLATVALESGSPADPRDGARFVTMSVAGADARVAFSFPRGDYGRHSICDFSWGPR